MMTIRVIADDREQKSRVIEYLKRLGAYVIVKRLEVGDYVVSEDLAVERKSVNDLIASIYDGRVFEQAKRLLEEYPSSFIIVEGDFNSTILSYEKPQVIYGAIAKLASAWGMPILFTPNAEHTAILIYTIARQEQEGKGKRIALRRKRKLSSLKDWQLFIVESLPGVGPVLAERLLEHFGSVRKIFNATSIELARVRGMTPSRAREIFRVINASYTSRHRSEGRNATLY
ncbi:MAG: hypothetical protein DRN15_08475 [Thermoprotei archaeon]|nr:MAG: hypothetical protein DRN15_08475 [Thermoprotei archaeon]RLF25770.1 MAG: hypothetical protein DRM97_00695 [Thermoprotei archaeon]